jgi:dissimilatory sulfite reductase (desulfoviridin) alpha/beta subunit
MTAENSVSITVLLPGGRLPLDVMETAHRLADRHGFGIYLSTAQNLRLINVQQSLADQVKEQLLKLGVQLKAPGKFPIPRVCVGQDHCKLGLIDTEAFSRKILDKFSGREKTKAKFKISVSACSMCCSNAKTTDIGIISTRNGYDVYAGGKGGVSPKVGRRIAKNVGEENVLEIMETLVEFHDKKTEKKKRIYKLLEDPEFPYPVV